MRLPWQTCPVNAPWKWPRCRARPLFLLFFAVPQQALPLRVFSWPRPIVDAASGRIRYDYGNFIVALLTKAVGLIVHLLRHQLNLEPGPNSLRILLE
jgi:hypothetical protein